MNKRPVNIDRPHGGFLHSDMCLTAEAVFFVFVGFGNFGFDVVWLVWMGAEQELLC